MQEYSPNWYWQQLGFTVERNGLLRTIRDQHGNEACCLASYETEIGIGRWLFDGSLQSFVNPLTLTPKLG